MHQKRERGYFQHAVYNALPSSKFSVHLPKSFLKEISDILLGYCCLLCVGTSCIGDGGAVSYSLDAPGPRLNAFRLLRAMQLCRPLLLEGAPGVGKTSLVTALAKFSGHDIVRINLSEQTVSHC